MPEETQPEQKPEERQEDKPAAAAPAGDDMATLTKTLLAERKARRDAEAKLEQREKESMTETERAVAAARDEGRAEASTAAARRLAAAEFRAAAAGKLGNAEAWMDVIDPGKFIGEDGEPDRAAIEATVAKLAANNGNGKTESNGNGKSDALPPGLSFPGGVRQPADAQGDWLREIASSR